MKVLMVSPFPPYRDGIATYAVQELQALRADGFEVDVVSPAPSAAPHHLPLGGGPGMAMLARLAIDYQRVIVQFGPEMLFGRCRSPVERVAVWLGLAGLARLAELDLRLHEIEYGPIERNPAERRAATAALRAARRVTVHTEAEREALTRLLGHLGSLRVVDHGRNFRPATSVGRDEARAGLGIPDHRFVFLSIGFLQAHKGFDRAVQAMASLAKSPSDAAPDYDHDHVGTASPHLYVVGSARVDHPEITGYVERLRRLCDRTPAATLVEGYVSDERFDQWLLAADCLVLPYREIWSSGVLERARLFGLPVIASDLGPLRDQVPPGSALAADDEELVAAMVRMLRERGRPVADGRAPSIDLAGGDPPDVDDGANDAEEGPEPWRVDDRAPDRASLQDQIVARARAGRLAAEVPTSTGPGTGPGDAAVDGLLAVGPLHRASPTSARPGVAAAKRVVQRLIDWRIEPVARQVEELQRATLAAVAELDRRTGVPTGRAGRADAARAEAGDETDREDPAHVN